MPKKLEIKSGDKFNRFTVIREVERRCQKRYFLCKCDCGTEKVVSLNNLRTGHSKSCGCFIADFNRSVRTKHGYCGSRLYEIWCGMKKRCLNPNNHAYKYYGGRGIKVSEDWIYFESFCDWALSNGYRDDLTLERLDFNGNYEPSNCSWIPLKEQNNNKKTSKIITYKGKTRSLKDWANHLGIYYQTLHGRLAAGWSVEKAFNTPVGTTLKKVVE